jgi:hypothetical protein
MCVLGRKLGDHFIWLGDHRLQEKGHLCSSKCSAYDKGETMRRATTKRRHAMHLSPCRRRELAIAKNAQLMRLLGSCIHTGFSRYVN